LARPVKIQPLTALGPPEVSADYRTWTFHLRPGIRFADDPAFKGQPRELVAQDYVYSLMRLADPALPAQVWGKVVDDRIVGLAERRQTHIDAHTRFDYGTPLPGRLAGRPNRT
jgi:ABC-type transport system substrate-binding protein